MAEEVGKLEESSDNTEVSRVKSEVSKGMVFAPGVSGNPKGKPPGAFSLVALLKKKLQECPPGENKKTYAELLIDRVLRASVIEGNVPMLKDIVDRVDGKAVQTMVVENEDDEELEELRGLLKELTTSCKKNDKPNTKSNGDHKLGVTSDSTGGVEAVSAPAADVHNRGEAGRPDANGGTSSDILVASIPASPAPADRELHSVRQESDGGAGVCDNIVHSGGVSVSGGSN